MLSKTYILVLIFLLIGKKTKPKKKYLAWIKHTLGYFNYPGTFWNQSQLKDKRKHPQPSINNIKKNTKNSRLIGKQVLP